MAAQFVNTQAVTLKGRLFTLTVLKLSTHVIADIIQQLDVAVAKAPTLFAQAPIVLDFTELDTDELSLADLISAIKDKGLLPVAVQTKNQTLAATAACLGLACLNASSRHDRDISVLETSLPGSSPVATSKTRLSPVRSGQQVVNKNGDLIITAPVSAGAEVLADGNIHIYGALRGRALAGLSGDINVRIYCQSLEAELVSIAGFYKLSDELLPCKTPCQIYLKEEQIIVEPLC
ncbi:MAG: septum site-determining protein MinC [Legionellaceae bacterium]|nr:septum site-determining protein MinC [Legionellaceae bacterium]